MRYEKEWQLLRDTFHKCHVRTFAVALDAPLTSFLDRELALILGGAQEEGQTLGSFLGTVQEKTVYKMADHMGLSYIYLRRGDAFSGELLFIGPYLSAPISSRQLLEWGERLGLAPKSQQYFEEYCTAIPVLTSDSHLFILLDTVCERVWGTSAYAVVDVNREHKVPVSPIHEASHTGRLDDVLVNMKTLELRYAYENEMMQAVTLGQSHKVPQLLNGLHERFMEQRAPDPLRNLKNYDIIMNTLLRKAAEQGGVHPVYLDRVSSDFAKRIEKLTAPADNATLMQDIFLSYCRLVRKHTMKQYSHIVQKTVLLIDSDLAADLSLRSLAENQGVSAGYLSTVFKKETGKTVSEYIRAKRIRHAMHLLTDTHLQVQTVALHCGILDVQYFSKIFKRETGKTPKEYRESTRQHHQ